MARNMIEANVTFFANIQSMLDEDLSIEVINSKRYIATNKSDQFWLKHLIIKHSFRITKDAFALLLCLKNDDYLCLINIIGTTSNLPPYLTELPLNAGLITVLGSEGYLTPKVNWNQQLQIFNEVMYQTSDIDYHGHQWNDIMVLFPPVHCYKIDLGETDVDIRENENAFYQVLCQAAFEIDFRNNPYTEISRGAWERVFYEGKLSQIKYKTLFMSYIALTWDISYLHLYQCLEDKFACEAVHSLHKRLDVGLSEMDLSRLLYEELSWQPKDIEGIEHLIENRKNTKGVDILQTVAGDEQLPRFIYSVRNSIVHETKAARIPLSDNKKWEKTIEGILYFLLDL